MQCRRRNPARVVKYDYNYIAMYVPSRYLVGNVKAAAASYFYVVLYIAVPLSTLLDI